MISYFNPSGELYSNLIYWLKSLKDRIQSQSQWNPNDKDKLRVKQAIMYLSKKLTFESEKDDYNFREGQIKWLNAHHFDYRDLIPKGLALEAPENLYNV